MNLGIFEDDGYVNLLPLTWLRSPCELICGQDRLLDKLVATTGRLPARLWTRPELAEIVAERIETTAADPEAPWLLFNARALVTGAFTPPPAGTAWVHGGTVVAASVASSDVAKLTPETWRDAAQRATWLADLKQIAAPDHVRLIQYPWDLVHANDAELRRQFNGSGTYHGTVHTGVHMLNAGAIAIAGGAVVKPGVVLDATDGPITIAAEAQIQPNAVIEGPCYIGPRSIVRPGSVIREATTIGGVCKVGGEIEASIIHGYSNKQHDGFLGHSYVGEWVNLGADTITSDLKNTYGTIRVALRGEPIETGRQFVGSTIGDHAKTGIGTILPTGCVLGVAANVFTAGVAPKFVPSFAWLTDEGLAAAQINKIVQIAETVMGRRKVTLTPAAQDLLRQVAAQAREIEAAGWC